MTDKPSLLVSLVFYLLSWAPLPPGVRGQGLGFAPVELAPIPCNDRAVEKLSRLALTYINEDRTDGYKFALNRITNVHLHAQGPAGNVYYLDLDVLETKCHVGSPKPWKRCDIRPFMETQISGNCNTTILHTTEGYSYLYSYDCTLVPDPPGKLQQTCPTCPLLLPADSPVAARAAGLTLSSHRRQSTLGAELGVKKVTRASSQVRPAKAIFVEYTVQDCPEGLTERGTCQRLTINSDTETAGFCAGSVHGDMEISPEVQVSCEMFKLQNVDHLRPVRPQGHDLTPAPAVLTPPPPTPDPKKDTWPLPSDPPPPPPPIDVLPDVHAPFDPAPLDPVPFDPSILASPFDPAPLDPVPFDPSILASPFDPAASSSSESSEEMGAGGRQPPRSEFSSSEEEVEGGPLALRPPFDFHYRKSDRRKRRASPDATPAHTPVFLSDFPSGSSPFRSCPGPARYTTA